MIRDCGVEPHENNSHPVCDLAQPRRPCKPCLLSKPPAHSPLLSTGPVPPPTAEHLPCTWLTPSQMVDPAIGGNAGASLDEVVSRLARHKAVYKGYGSAREALLLNGRFILQQLSSVDAARRSVAAANGKDKGKGAAGATEWAFYKGLEAEVGGQEHTTVPMPKRHAIEHVCMCICSLPMCPCAAILRSLGVAYVAQSYNCGTFLCAGGHLPLLAIVLAQRPL